MAIDLESLRYFKNRLNAEYEHMYEARDNAIQELQSLVEENGGEIHFDEPIGVTDVDGGMHDVDSLKIGSRGTVNFFEGDGAYSLFFLDILTLMNFLDTIAYVLARNAE